MTQWLDLLKFHASCVMPLVRGNALISADLALAGVKSRIPVDEVIEAMDKVGRNLPAQLRETGLGGLAGTPTGEAIKQKIFGNAEDPVNSFS